MDIMDIGMKDRLISSSITQQPVSDTFQPSTTEDVTKHLMQLYEKGSKTALSKLRKPLLAVLCAVKFSRNCDAMKKQELLDEIYEAVSHYLCYDHFT